MYSFQIHLQKFIYVTTLKATKEENVCNIKYKSREDL
jgi:hypothetical protein